ncbi:hypothetical protein GIB67_032954 [Kingdonia uniflora]|uniref:Pentatricopeptide repeat-containing protein n=1 Tax=Kingdonia uniflora TaxID=39325 RepID=A0A7J7MYK6_9MAGN|nr:hypothetical protein GIB67_032954 [Kingdonia uniflora]
MYILWISRNEMIFEQKQQHTGETLKRAKISLIHINEVASHIPKITPRTKEGWHVIFVDAAWKNADRTGGTGYDSVRASDPEEAEAASVIRGMEAAHRLGMDRILNLTDCQRLVHAFRDRPKNLLWGALTLAQDIRALVSHFRDFILDYVDRRCNIQIHAQIIITQQQLQQQPFWPDSVLIAALIRSYVSSHDIVSARTLFDHYPCVSPPTILWNLMIQAYSKKPNSQESLFLFRRMLERERSTPDQYTLTFVITSCSHQKLLIFGETVHGVAVKIGCDCNIFVGNSLVSMYSVFARVRDSQSVFDGMGKRDVVTWTSLLNGYVRSGDMGESSELFDEMPERNDVSWAVMIAGYVGVGKHNDALRCFRDMLCDDKVKPNEAVLVCVLSACAHLGALDQGKWIHIYVDRSKVKWSSNVCTALIDMYTKCGELDCAKKVFNGVTKRDVLTWTSMITGFAMHGLGVHAVWVFRQMLAEGTNPDSITLVGVLNGCSHSGLVNEGCSIFYNMKNLWGVDPKIEHYGCLIDLLGRAGHLEKAFEIVKNMPIEPDIIIYRALISACRIHGDVCLGEQIINHISRNYTDDNGGGHVLLSNLYASLGRWDGVGEMRKKMQKMKIESDPGCSWIEIDGSVHEFLVADQLHPQIQEIRNKLTEVLKRVSTEGGYVADTKQVLFDLSEEDKEQAVSWHSEKLALAFGLLKMDARTPIRIVKNLRICQDCHSAMKAVSRVFGRKIIIRDRSRFHTFREGSCSCADYW